MITIIIIIKKLSRNNSIQEYSNFSTTDNDESQYVIPFISHIFPIRTHKRKSEQTNKK